MSHETATGRFAAEMTDRELLDVVGEVARAVRPAEPESLSQPQFDAYVEAHRDGHPGVPTARAIYMRLNSGSLAASRGSPSSGRRVGPRAPLVRRWSRRRGALHRCR